MKIRDSHAELVGDKTVFESVSGGISVLSEDGREMFGVRLQKDGSLEITGGQAVRRGDVMLGGLLTIEPRAANVVHIRKLSL